MRTLAEKLLKQRVGSDSVYVRAHDITDYCYWRLERREIGDKGPTGFNFCKNPFSSCGIKCGEIFSG